MNINDPTLRAVRKAALHVGYDGIIHRGYTEDEYLRHCTACLNADGVYHADIMALEKWLEGMSPEDLETVCIGEHEAMSTLLQTSPIVEGDNVPVSDMLDAFWNG